MSPALALDGQHTLSLRPYQLDVIAKSEAAEARGCRRQLWVLPTGTGKAQPVDEPVLTPDGWRPIGELQVGDRVIGADGLPAMVKGVFPQGVRPVFRVTFDDGAWTRCDPEHLWTVATDTDLSTDVPWRTMTTAQLVFRGLTSPEGRRRWRVPVMAAAAGDDLALPVPAYTLGVLLGDGCLRRRESVTFTTADLSIAANVAVELPELRIVRVKDDRVPTFRISSGIGCTPNPVTAGLRLLGLMGKGSLEKEIPEPYLRATLRDRLRLLQGIMDTDGTQGRTGTTFTTISPRLAEGVAELVRSLGGVVRTSSRIPTYSHLGERRQGQLAYTLRFRLPAGVEPFSIARKRVRWQANPTRLAPTRKIRVIEPDGEAEQVCIMVDAPDSLYVTRSHIVTHNTVCFVALAAKRGDRTLIIAHRDELIGQAAAKARQWWPDADIGTVKAERNEVWAQDIVVASVQSLSPARLARLGHFGLVIVDECFPAGTMVGERRIEDVKVGDLVPSYDETTGEVVDRPVLKVMTRPSPGLLRVTFEDGTDLVCTSGHPLMTSEGWEIAGGLTHGASVLSFAHHADTSGDDLRGVQRTDDLDGQLQDQQVEVDGAGVLLRPVPEGKRISAEFDQDGSDQPQARLGTNAGTEPDAPTGVGGEDASDLAADRAPTISAGRQREGALATADRPRQRADVAYRVDREDGEAPATGGADALQTGHRSPDLQGGDRGGRAIAWLAGPPRSRPSQGRVPQWKRVARVEVLEPGSDGRYDGDCPDGLVYNLHVAGTNTYLVGDGVVAHNCHHASSASYTRVLTGLRAGTAGGPLLVGVTATPDRADGKGLDSHFSEIVVSYDILWAIRAGYLVDIRCKEVKLENLRLENVTVSRGDYAEGQLGRAMTDANAPWHIVKAWKQLAAGRLTASFHPTILAAQEQAQEFNAQGVPAACVSGVDIEERRRILRALEAGRLKVVTNAAVLTEGWDFPALSCIIQARPTKSRGLYVQIVGRSLRPFPGKDDALVLDVTDSSERMDLCSVPTLFGVEKRKVVRQERTVTEALDEQAQEKIREAARQPQAPRTTGDVVTRDVDLFKAHGVKPGRVAWAKTRLGGFAASAGKISVVMEQTSKDCWRVVTVDQAGKRNVLMANVPLTLAQGIADDYVRNNAPEKLTNRFASWRKKPPTDKQLVLAQKLGIGVRPEWSSGEVARAIDARFAEIRLAKARR